jgi:peptidoglycan/LPS O-acetylase OafA/YrhL
MRGRGAVSLVVLALSWLALDDITTDDASEFPLEYAILVSAGLWFAALALVLIARRRFFAGTSSLVAVALGVAAFWSLPQHYQPPSTVNYLGWVALAWFAGVTVWLLAARAGRGQDQPPLGPVT